MFIGYHTAFGPHGNIEASTRAEAESEAASLLDRYPNAQQGKTRQAWFDRIWHITIWSKIELSGND
jgi:hypothetical protein